MGAGYSSLLPASSYLERILGLTIERVSIAALKGRQLQLGDEVLPDSTGECHSCSCMEELGPGGHDAVRKHGGLTVLIACGGLMQATRF